MVITTPIKCRGVAFDSRLRRDKEGIDVKAFVAANPEIYARAKDGGERAKTVHVRHTDAAFSGYIPPKGNEVNFNMRKTPLLIEEARIPGKVEFVFGPDHYMYIELHDKLEQVTQFCYDHFYRLRSFHVQSKAQS
ncbi:MAG: hypothetical protein WBM15_06000 [Chromatiaceae bacterium]